MVSPGLEAYNKQHADMLQHAKLIQQVQGGTNVGGTNVGGGVEVPKIPGASGSSDSINTLANMQQMQIRNRTFDNQLNGGYRKSTSYRKRTKKSTKRRKQKKYKTQKRK